MTKEELAKKKGLKNALVNDQSPSEALLSNKLPKPAHDNRKEPDKIKINMLEEKKSPTSTTPIKIGNTIYAELESETNTISDNASTHSKRGRKKGTTFVPENQRKISISISVAPEDDELYKKVISKYPKRFKSMSQLIEQALDEFIRKNNLI